MDLRFFALVHKYSLVLDSIKIEKVIFFRFFGGGAPLIYTCRRSETSVWYLPKFPRLRGPLWYISILFSPVSHLSR